LLTAEHRPIRSFVRREGRLTPAQQRALHELLPRYQIQPGNGHINLAAVFGNQHPVVLEIGFGNGALLAQQAALHPDINFIGIEVHRPGVGRLLQQLQQQGNDNVRVMSLDAVEVLEQQIPPAALMAVWLYFPDPWPKKRHHKRRIVNSHFLDLAATALQANGILHMATDWQDYAQHMQEAITAHARFERIHSPVLSTYPFSRPLTHFEQRGQKKGHSITDLYALVR
jgi:tRNA (guanine-N7-)-methyltransferase